MTNAKRAFLPYIGYEKYKEYNHGGHGGKEVFASKPRVLRGENFCLSEEEKWCIFMRYRHDKRAARLVEKLYREEEAGT
jgi:hypothetical protein